jgi:hypothetical protein
MDVDARRAALRAAAAVVMAFHGLAVHGLAFLRAGMAAAAPRAGDGAKGDRGP